MEEQSFLPAAWPLLAIAILCTLILIAIGIHEFRQGEQCQRQHCLTGKPLLLDHQCVCIERPVAP